MALFGPQLMMNLRVQQPIGPQLFILVCCKIYRNYYLHSAGFLNQAD